ncbi:MAG: thiolase family protein [Thaumarchaeota archaeon]|nr:thiolase family protein [Nitrososphaerota archaeon]
MVRLLQEAVIVDSVRTPIGKYGGILSSVRPDDLAALLIRSLIERNHIDPNQIEDVFFGDGNQAGEDNRNIARMALLIAGLPVKVAGSTVNRLCGSGLEAINQAAHAVMVGNGGIYIAGGVESMSRAPFAIPKSAKPFSRLTEIYDTTLGWRFLNPVLADKYYPYSMGETAENLATRYSIPREEQDLFALNSHERAVRATNSGTFKEEIIPVPIKDSAGKEIVVDRDEGPRSDTSLEKLAQLKPAFRKGGTVTAGNSSGVNDGAAAVLIMNEKKAKNLGLTPKARIVSTAVAGVAPKYMGLGPVPSTKKALRRAKVSLDSINLVEINEAFAAQVLSCLKFIEFDNGRMNVNGGAIALGHPIGCSGARIMTTLLHEMERRKVDRGLATACIGVGQGIATVVERV